MTRKTQKKLFFYKLTTFAFCMSHLITSHFGRLGSLKLNEILKSCYLCLLMVMLEKSLLLCLLLLMMMMLLIVDVMR